MFAKQKFYMPKKKPEQLSLFPETQYQYHVLLSPADAIKNDVAAMKETLNGIVGIAAYNFTPAHITLHEFEAPESINVKELLKNALACERPFTVKVNGYDTWTTTFILKIENPEPVAAIAAIIKNPHKAPVKRVRQTSIIDKPERKPKLSITPHITVARHLPEDYKEKIIDYSPFDYQNEWVCESVTILQRKAGDAKSKKIEIRLKG